jgi:hypothetical protein
MPEQEVIVQPEIQSVPKLPETTSLLDVIVRAARDPEVQIDKMQALLNMHERIMAQQAEQAYTQAMNRVQANVPRVEKKRRILAKGGGTRSKYAALEDIDEVLRPLTIKEGFALSYSTEDVPPKSTRIILTVKHQQGHQEHFMLVLPIEKTEFRSASQDAAATVSFGKRLLRCMAFDVVTVDEDRDGADPPPDCITAEQVATIADLLRQCNIPQDNPSFLSWVGTDKIEHIQNTAYLRVVNELKKRVAAKQRPAKKEPKSDRPQG